MTATDEIAYVDEDPSVAMTEWDKQRARSRQTADARAEGKFGVGPSDCHSCPRAVQYRERPPEGHVPKEINRLAAILGTWIHTGLTEARRLRYPWCEFNVKVPVPGLDKPGEADEYDERAEKVTDYKTGSVRKWDRIGADGPPDGEWEQAFVYALALILMGKPVRTVELLYIKRDNGEPEVFRRDYDPEFAFAALSKLHALMEGLEQGWELPRTHSGPTTDVICRDWCEHVAVCWDLPAVPEGRTPESWDRFGADFPEVDDPDVAELLADYRAAHALETTGKATKDELKAILAGVRDGTYGAHTVKTAGGKLGPEHPDLAGRVEQLERQIRLAIDAGSTSVLRDPVDLPMPTVRKRTSEYLDIKPVRKAKLEKKAREAANA